MSLNERSRHWTAVCQFEGKESFHYSSPKFDVIAADEETAIKLLEPIIKEQWDKLMPFPMPEVIKLVPGQLVMQYWRTCDDADERRTYG